MVDVSVIIPTYNRAHFLSKTIDSVLEQDYDNYEVLVVDDGSTDHTRQVVEAYSDHKKVRYIYQQNAGPSMARNTGIALANGKYIAFLDSDDTFFYNKLRIQMEYVKNHPDCYFLHSYYYNVDTNDNIMKIREPRRCATRDEFRFRLLTRGFTIRTSTVVIHKEVFDRVGLFEPEYSYSQDWDMWLRIAKFYRGHRLAIPLAGYRIHSNNRSRQAVKRYHPAIYKKALKLYNWSTKDLWRLNENFGTRRSDDRIRTIEKVIE